MASSAWILEKKTQLHQVNVACDSPGDYLKMWDVCYFVFQNVSSEVLQVC